MAASSSRVYAASAFVAIAVLFGGAVVLHRTALAVAENPQSSPDELMAVSQRWIPQWRVEVFVALAQNPSSPGVLLAAMAEPMMLLVVPTGLTMMIWEQR